MPPRFARPRARRRRGTPRRSPPATGPTRIRHLELVSRKGAQHSPVGHVDLQLADVVHEVAAVTQARSPCAAGGTPTWPCGQEAVLRSGKTQAGERSSGGWAFLPFRHPHPTARGSRSRGEAARLTRIRTPLRPESQAARRGESSVRRFTASGRSKDARLRTASRA